MNPDLQPQNQPTPPVTQTPPVAPAPVQPVQPVQPLQQTIAQPVPPTTDPGMSTAIGAIILGFVIGAPFGLALSIVAMNRSRKAGRKNTLALVFTILFAIGTPFWIIAIINLFSSLG